MLINEQPTDIIQPPDEQLNPIYPLKKSYMTPKLTCVSKLDISNNLSGGGDGDAALAHS